MTVKQLVRDFPANASTKSVNLIVRDIEMDVSEPLRLGVRALEVATGRRHVQA